MEVTKQYKKRLVHLAKEVMALNKPTIVLVENDQERGRMAELMRIRFTEKLALLLGYILALDDAEESA